MKLLLLASLLCVVVGQWEQLKSMPAALTEVTSILQNGVLYVMGGSVTNNFAYNIATDTWSVFVQRPYPGHHHAAVNPDDGTFWLVGGLEFYAEGTLQKFDINQNTWTVIDMPEYLNRPGSVSAVLVNGVIYFCGGLDWSGVTKNLCATYTIATNTFGTMASMPVAMNKAAFGTDGLAFYIFAGRQTNNYPDVGFDYVQKYTFATGTWTWSGAPGSDLAPIPQARAGMGAVYYAGYFFVFGGETSVDPPTNGVYSRVDIYDSFSNTWTAGVDMPIAKHSVYPVTDGSYIYTAGGGVVAGDSVSSSVHRIFIRALFPTTTTTTKTTTTSTTTTTTTTTKTTTTTTTTTTKPPIPCPHSGSPTLTTCVDGSQCNPFQFGWGCCAGHQGRLACPSNRPFICAAKNCGSDYCCAPTGAACANGLYLSGPTCPKQAATTTVRTTSKTTTRATTRTTTRTTTKLTTRATTRTTTKLTTRATTKTTSAVRTTTKTAGKTTSATRTAVRTTTTKRGVASTTTKTSTTTRKTTTTTVAVNCKTTTYNYQMRCVDGTFCGIYYGGNAWNCCASHGGRSRCPIKFPVTCGPAVCSGRSCCDAIGPNACDGNILPKADCPK